MTLFLHATSASHQSVLCIFLLFLRSNKSKISPSKKNFTRRLKKEIDVMIKHVFNLIKCARNVFRVNKMSWFLENWIYSCVEHFEQNHFKNVISEKRKGLYSLEYNVIKMLKIAGSLNVWGRIHWNSYSDLNCYRRQIYKLNELRENKKKTNIYIRNPKID